MLVRRTSEIVKFPRKVKTSDGGEKAEDGRPKAEGQQTKGFRQIEAVTLS